MHSAKAPSRQDSIARIHSIVTESVSVKQRFFTDNAEALARAEGLRVVRRTDLPVDAEPRADVVVLDTMGELAHLFQIATLVFVGGSLADYGGHNILEPAIFGTLLERALNPEERHQLGAHFTPRAYVERLVLPRSGHVATLGTDLDLLVDPITGVTTLLDIAGIQIELQALLGVPVDVLTPAALPEKFRAQVLSEATPI